MKVIQARLTARLNRARSAKGQGITYKLGRGGFNSKFPSDPGWDMKRSDCSGYVSWVLMLRRAPKLIRPFWIETTAVWKDAQGKQRTFCQIPKPIAGCIVVFPDMGGREGHIGIVTAVNGVLYDVIDCTSKGVTEHPGGYFQGRRDSIFCVLREDMEVEG